MPVSPFDEGSRGGDITLKIISTPEHADAISDVIMAGDDEVTDNIAIRRQEARDHKGRKIIILHIEHLDYGANEAIKKLLADANPPSIVVDEEDSSKSIRQLMRDAGFRAALDDFFNEEAIHRAAEEFFTFESQYQRSIKALTQLARQLNDSKNWAFFKLFDGHATVVISTCKDKKTLHYEEITSNKVFNDMINALQSAGLKENMHFTKYDSELEGVIKSSCPKSIEIKLDALEKSPKLIEAIEALTRAISRDGIGGAQR